MPQLYRLTDTADAQLSTVNYQLSIGDDINALVANLAQRIFNGEKITYDPDLLHATVKPYLDGITKGYGKSLADVDWDTPDFKTLQKLTENVFQFSASKDFNLLSDMTNALKGSDGKLRSFDEFRQEVDRMNAKYNVNWLRTEYNQAVAASQCAARWTDFESRADKNPFLQYQAVMDANTRAEHAALNGVIKRYDDDFWDKYYPPNGWGCRCEVIQLPGKNHKETPDMDLKHCKVAPMFQVNVGKKGVIFPKGHPYFMGQCATNSCPLKSRKLADGTLTAQCQGCLQGMEDCEKYVDRCKKIAESKKEWNNIDTNIWNKTKFYPESGGFIAAHKQKAPDNDKDKTGGVHGENTVNELLAKAGKRIYRLPDNVSDKTPILGKPYKELLKYKADGSIYGFPDDYFDGQTWDIKKIDDANENTIRSYIKDGRKADNVIMYFEKDKIGLLTNAVLREAGKRKPLGELNTLPNIYLINDKGDLTRFWTQKSGLVKSAHSGQ